MHDISPEKQTIQNEGFVARYFSDIRTIILIVITLMGAGVVIFFNLPKELNPSIKIPIVTISTVYPGANPEDVKELVTIPLEDSVSGLKGITKTTSTSQEGLSLITLEFTSSTDPDQAKQDVQGRIDTVNDIPEDALDSAIQVVDFQNQPVITFALTGKTDPQSLRVAVREMEEGLKNLSVVERVSLQYNQPLEVSITLKQNDAKTAGLNPFTLNTAIEKALANIPGGNLATDKNTFALGINRALFSVEDIRQLPVDINGQTLLLGDVATIEEKPAPNNPHAWYATQDTPVAPAVFFSVFKTDSADATTAVDNIYAELDTLNQKHGSVFTIAPIFDGAKEIKKSFDQLFHDFFLTVGLVFIILILFFGIRQSIVSSFAIPLTFLITFIVMGGAGISINFIALFSLLLALGILVDNVIVIISAMASYERLGHHTPSESALLVYRDFRSVIFTTTITTIWAFLPLLLASGIIGEFIRPIPIVVSSALAISAMIALFVVIPVMAALQTGHFARRVVIFGYVLLFALGVVLLYVVIPAGPYKTLFFLVALILLAALFWQRKQVHSHKKQSLETATEVTIKKRWHQIADEGFLDLHPLATRYEQFIRDVLASSRKRKRTIIALIIFAIFSYALVPTGYVVNEFFPQDDQEIVYASVELPKGTSLAESNLEALRFIEELRTLDDVRFVTAEVGAGVPNDSGINQSNSNELLFTLLLTPKEERDITSGAFVNHLNTKYQERYPGGDFSASQLSGGPPAGSDIQIKLLGEDLLVLDQYGKKIEQYLQEQGGVSQVKSSFQTGSGKIVFIPDRQRMLELGVSEDTLAYWVRALGSGITLVEDARFGEEKRDIVLRVSQEELSSPEDVSRFVIPTNRGSLPLSSLGRFELGSNPTRITREDGKQTLSVSAAVADNYSVSTINKSLEEFADTLDLPAGYSWKTGGVNEENDKSVQSILEAMLLSAILIFATMTIQFRSFRKSLIVLFVIPLAICGVFIVFALTGTPLSFPALIGILALFGIVVNNSIIMVDKINRNMDKGQPLIDAISEGAASRLEPILLTAITTIVGLIPITLSDPIWQGLGGAIIAGLLFSGIAKLFMIPVLYWVFYGEKTE